MMSDGDEDMESYRYPEIIRKSLNYLKKHYPQHSDENTIINQTKPGNLEFDRYGFEFQGFEFQGFEEEIDRFNKSERELWSDRKIHRLNKKFFRPSTSSSSSYISAFAPNNIQCPICYDKFNSSEIATLQCNHGFCKGCWHEYCRGKEGEEEGEEINCPLCRRSIVTSVPPLPINEQFYIIGVSFIHNGSRSPRDILQSDLRHSRHFNYFST